MQVIDEEKRLKILSAAAEKFASQAFHKVLLSDVAAAAMVGKGTLYTYFKSKEELYLEVLYSGFSKILDQLRDRMERDPLGPAKELDLVIEEIIRFAYQNPHQFEVMRAVPNLGVTDRTRWEAKRKELTDLIESILRRGIALGAFQDSNPELTSQYIPGLVRAALLKGVETVDRKTLTRHVLRFVRAALGVRKGKAV